MRPWRSMIAIVALGSVLDRSGRSQTGLMYLEGTCWALEETKSLRRSLVKLLAMEEDSLGKPKLKGLYKLGEG